MRLLLTGMLVLAVVGCAATPQTPQKQSQVQVSDQEMDELAAIWRKYRMPQVPAEAPLVLIKSLYDRSLYDPAEPPELSLAFQLRPATDTSAPTLFDGTGTLVLPSNFTERTIERVVLEDVRLQSVRERYHLGELFDYRRMFALGVICWSRGENELGRQLVAEAVRREYRSGGDNTRRPGAEQARELAAWAIWGYWFNRAFLADSNRAEIVEVLKPAIEELECLHSRTEHQPEARHLLAELETALVPSRAEPGSVAHLVDSLTEVHWDTHWYGGLGRWVELLGESAVPTTIKQLLLAGVDAVPTLMEHVNDKRITRGLHSSLLWADRPQYVGDLVSYIVRCLTDGAVCPNGTDSEDSEARLRTDRQLQDWWVKVQTIGERKYLLDCMASAQARDFYSLAEEAFILVLGHRHPDALPDAYTESLTRGQFVSLAWTEAIARSTLQLDEKLRLLEQGAMCADTHHPRIAMQQIRELHPGRFDELVLTRLQQLEGKLPDRGPFTSDERLYPLLVQLSESDEVWAALLDLACRAEPTIRVRILGRFGSRDDAALNPDRTLSFLASFLDDNSVRHRNDEVTECDPVLDWRTISVGNFAASRISELLKLEPAPDSSWRKSQWAALHTQVSEALKQRGIQPMAQSR